MRRKAVAAVLVALTVGLPGAPSRAAAPPGPADAETYWVEGILLSVDAERRTVSYRVATGAVASATVFADSPLRKLASFHAGQPIRLRCVPGDATPLVVEAKKGGPGRNWWKWGVLTFLGFFLAMMLWAGASSGSDALL